MTKYNGARENSDSELELARAYTKQIIDSFAHSKDSDERTKMLSVLERIAQGLREDVQIQYESLIRPKKVIKIRKDEGLSQVELAYKLGISQSELSRYENGRRPPQGENGKRYLGWLRVRGYNPYKI